MADQSNIIFIIKWNVNIMFLFFVWFVSEFFGWYQFMQQIVYVLGLCLLQ